MTTRRNRHAADDIEISICVEDDVQPKNRKKGKKIKKKQNVKKEDNGDDIFGGIDVEGIPDNEKEDIRRAILASRNDTCTRYEDSSQTDFSEKEEIESIPDDDTSIQVSDDDILHDKTTEDDEELEVYLAATQKDDLNSTTKSDVSSQEKNQDKDLLELNEQDVDLIEDEDDILDLSKSTLNDDDYETQKPESPVEPTLNYEVEDEEINKVTSTSQASRPDQQKISDQSQGPRIKSASVRRYDSQTKVTERSKQDQGSTDSQGQRSSQRSASSDSRGSGGFVPTVQESSSQNSQKSLSNDEPLVRHYRAVKFQLQRGPSYYCPESADPKLYIKVISRMIDNCNRELKHAQKLFREKLPWPESVKPGQHHEKTIDVKRRGHSVQVFDMTMLDDDDFKAGPPTKATRVQVPVVVNSDDDLPDLFVEDSSDRPNGAKTYTPVRNDKTDSNKVRFSAAEAAAIITNTIEEEDDIVLSKDTSDSISKAPASLGEGLESKKKRKQGIRKRAQKVLAPETQVDDYTDDIFETMKKPKIDAVVAETQFIDENDWLNADKSPLGNQNQRQGLRGYTIPRINKEQNNNNKSNSNSEATRQANIKTQSNKKKKVKPKVLVEETQDLGFDELLNDNKTRNQKLKRTCFKIDSVSSDDDEPVAETQLDNSPNREDLNEYGEGNHGELSENEKENKPQGFFAKMRTRAMNTVKSMFSPTEEPIQESPDNEPESPIIKRSRTKKLFTNNPSKFDKTPTSERDSGSFNYMLKPQKEVNTSGVRVFGRNASKESILSNNSDDVSVASSQVSNTLLDDNGDLYSTQFPEMIDGKKSGRKRKAGGQQSDREINKSALENKTIEDAEYSDDDVMVIDVDTKGKPQPQEGKGLTSANKRQRVIRNKRIDHCFTKEKLSPEDNIVNERNIPTEYDSADEHNRDRKNYKLVHENEFKDENPFPKTYSKKNLSGANKIVNNFEKNTSQSNSAIADMLSGSHKNSNPQLVKIVRADGWTTEHIVMNPVDVQNFAGTSQTISTRNQTTRGQKGQGESRHRKEVFNLDPDEVEISDEESNSGQKETSNQRKEHVEMIDCPLCAKQFSADTIQEHAENCQGQEEEEAIPQQEDIPHGEMDICCICEREVPKNLLERHVQDCWQNMAKQQQQQQAAKEEPVQTRRTKLRTNTDTGDPVTTTRSPRLHRDSPLRYLPENSSESDSQSTDGSSWDDSDTSGSDDNITLKSIALSGSAALVDGPWNKNKKTVNQSNGDASDWLQDISNSPIKSFVPISQQEDSEYYHKQFNYNKKKVEQRQAKRKRAQGKQKRRKKRRKVRKKKTKE